MNTQMPAFEPLITLLDELLGQYRKLLDLAGQKKESIISNHVDDLEQVVRTETAELLKAGGIEKKRLAVTEALLAQMNVSNQDTTLADLIALAPEPAQTKLKAFREEFSTVVAELLALNQTNRELLETGIAYTDMMLKLIVGADDPLNNFYTDTGSTDATEGIANPGLFDQQI